MVINTCLLPSFFFYFLSYSSLNQWAKLNDKGEQCLSQQVLGQSSTDLDAIVEECKRGYLRRIYIDSYINSQTSAGNHV